MNDALLRLRIWLTAADPRARGERGASLVEYALLVALIAVVCVIAIQFLGQEAESSFSSTGSGLAGN